MTLIANLVRANQTSLELELEKSDSPPIILPIIYNALVPDITIAPDIKMRACFLDFAYKAEVVVTSNEFRGYFTLEDDEVQDIVEQLKYVKNYIPICLIEFCIFRTLHFRKKVV